jgi:CIC family chloride channel protein
MVQNFFNTFHMTTATTSSLLQWIGGFGENFRGWLGHMPIKARDLIRTVLYGVTGGLAAVAFQKSISWLYQAIWPPLSALDGITFAWTSLVVITLAHLLSGFLLAKACPEAAGSGIPQLKVSFWRDFGFLPLRVAVIKFVAGTLSIGSGASLGREGPTVHIAGALASNVAGWTGVAKQDRRGALAAGAAAGLASAFNTPLSAITFVLEEIIDDLGNARYLGRTLLAAVIATLITHLLLGADPAFVIPSVPDFSSKLYLLVPVAAGAAAVIGGAFQLLTLRWRDHLRETSRLPAGLRPVVGALCAWGLGMLVFFSVHRLGVFSLGYGDLEDMLHNKLLWSTVLALLAAKFLATSACYAWNGCGGIFAPTLFLGASAGLSVANLFDVWIPLTPEEHILLAVIGMSACLGAVVRAPITSILIVFEMTHEFSFVPVLMLGTLVSQAVSRLMLKDNFYADILNRDGIQMEKIIPPRTLAEWQRHEVASIANFNAVVASSPTPHDLKTLAEAHPYSCFPLVQDGRCNGVLTRPLLEKSLLENTPAIPVSAPEIHPDESIRAARDKLVEAPVGLLLLVSRPDRLFLGILTLHDLLRAQARAIELEEK